VSSLGQDQLSLTPYAPEIDEIFWVKWTTLLDPSVFLKMETFFESRGVDASYSRFSCEWSSHLGCYGCDDLELKGTGGTRSSGDLPAL